MTLNDKLDAVVQRDQITQTREGLALYVGKLNALNLWSDWNTQYDRDNGNALHRYALDGRTDIYVAEKTKAFIKFAHEEMIKFDRHLATRSQEEMHHVAQENKLKRLRTGDYFP